MRVLANLTVSLILLLFGTRPLSSQSKPAFELTWDSHRSLDTSILVTVHSSLPHYYLRAIANDSGARVTVLLNRAEVIDTINVISLYEYFEHSWPPGDLTPASILLGEDFNFDGYLDLALINNIDDRLGNPSYSIWLFDRKSRSFRESQQFTDRITWDFTLDKRARTITTNDVNPFRTEDCTTTTYKVTHNKLSPIRIETVEALSSTDTSTIRYLCTLQKLVRNQLKLTKRAMLRTSAEIKEFFEH